MKTSFCILLLSIPICIFAQKSSKEKVPGAIITKTFDTIVTYIEKDKLIYMQKRVFYYDENKKKVKLDPNESQGFILFKKGGHLYFESRGDFKFAIINQRKSRSFLYRLLDKPVQLYYFVYNKSVQSGFHYTYEGKPYYLIYKDWLHEWHTIDQDEFRNGCKKAFADDKELMSDIKEGKYSFDDMEIIVERYTEFVKREYFKVLKAKGSI